MPKPYTTNDQWSRKAAELGYRARSVFKLMELNERYTLLRPGMNVLDLGAAPGSWLQYASEQVGHKGIVIGLDLETIEPIAKNVRTAKANALNPAEVTEKLRAFLPERASIDIVLSDMAPKTSGIKDIDQWKSVELCTAATHLARDLLLPGKTCVLKVFRGADFDAFLSALKNDWDVRVRKATASRDRSFEVYLVMKRKGRK